MTRAKRKDADEALREPQHAWPTHERQQRGQFVEARTYEFEPNPEGGSPERRPVRTIRDLNASAMDRLKRAGLSPAQVMAATMFERDHETGRLEPRVTANLLGAGGAKVGGMPETVIAARTRKHHALNALRLGGPDVVRVVEAVVLEGVTVTAVGETQNADRRAAKAWAKLALEVGLNLLEAHYRAEGRMTG